MQKPLIVMLSAAALSACATMSEGTATSVAIDTPGVRGATCVVADASGKAKATTKTPGSVTLQRARGDLTVTCSQAGYRTASATLASAMADKAKVQMPTGYVVDAVSGAMWTYPDHIDVALTRN